MRDERYEIIREPGKVILKGKIRLSNKVEYASIVDMLRTACEEVDESLEIDATQLQFLNSSGIAVFSIFVQEVRDNLICKRLVFVTNATRFAWQAKWIKNLRKLWSGVQAADRTGGAGP